MDMDMRKIIKEEMDDMEWIRDYQPQKINDPLEKNKVFNELVYSLYDLPRSTYPSDIKAYFDNMDITKFDSIIKKIRNLAIDYKTFK